MQRASKLDQDDLKAYGLVALKGIAMGAADVVPGVSGGTIAFITGIYERLLNAIRAFSAEGLKCLLAKDLKGAWNAVDGRFLVALGLGVGTSILGLSRVVLYLLDNFPVHLWAFFFGLIVAATLLVLREVKEWTPATGGAFLGGAVVAYLVTSMTPTQTPESLVFVFITGAIAITAMILPGISGSFMLVLFGKYEFILGAIKTFNLAVIGTFGAGCAVGLLSFSHALTWLLKRYHAFTIALVSGFMAGSLNKVWPWKETLETYTNRHGKVVPLVQKNIFPDAVDASVLAAVALMVGGFVFVIGIERIAKRMAPQQTEQDNQAETGAAEASA